MTLDTAIPFYLSYVALWILVIFQTLILLGLVRMVSQLQQTGAVAGVSEGQEAPAINAIDLSGAPINSKHFAGRQTALLFVSTSCSLCAEALANIDYLQKKTNQGIVIVICQAGRADSVRLVGKYDLNIPVIADEDLQISRAYSVSSVPTAVIINENNHIKSHGQLKRAEELNEALPKQKDALRQAES
jgi:peroxiredoxin